MAQIKADPESFANFLDLPEGLRIVGAALEIGEQGHPQIVFTLDGTFHEEDGTEVVYSKGDDKVVVPIYQQDEHGAVRLMGLEES